MRLHAPNEYGDNLMTMRKVIRVVNELKRPIEAFEQGRHFLSYRYIYPIFKDHNHVANVELGINFSSVIKEMQGYLPAHYQAIVKYEVALPLLFPSVLSQYRPFEIEPNYLYEFVEDDQRSPISRDLAQGVLNSVKQQVIEKMTEGHSFALPCHYKGKYYTVSFIPIKDISDMHIGYFVVLMKDERLQGLSRSVLKDVVALCLFLTILSVISYKKVKDSIQIKELNKLYMSSINALPDPFYLIDANTMEILLANKKGYDRGPLPKGLKCYELSHKRDTPVMV